MMYTDVFELDGWSDSMIWGGLLNGMFTWFLDRIAELKRIFGHFSKGKVGYPSKSTRDIYTNVYHLYIWMI